jgi:hypothetical protein
VRRLLLGLLLSSQAFGTLNAEWVAASGGMVTQYNLCVGGSGGNISALGSTGTSGYFLQSQGAGANPTWAEVSSAFSAITSATNTSAAMVVGNGASLAVSGSGTIAATTAAALAANPSACSAGQYVTDIAADGTLTCAAINAKPFMRWTARSNEPPSSSFCTLDTRNSQPVLDCDADADESVVVRNVMPSSYANGGLTVDIYVSATSATSGNMRWDAQIENLDDQDKDSDGFASAQSVTCAASGTSGKTTVCTITFTDGAQMDSVDDGDEFRLKITRDANHGTDDTMTGDAEISAVSARET